MLRYLAGRLGLAIPTLLLCTAIVFFVGALTGRSYYEKKRADPNVDLAQIRAEEKAEGLDQPLWRQYLRWLARLACNVHFARVEMRVQDFEDAGWKTSGIEPAPGARLAQTSADAASGRFALALRAAGEGASPERVALRCGDLAAFLRASWNGADARAKRPWDRFERASGAEDPLDEARYSCLRFSLRRGRAEAAAASSCEVRLIAADARATWTRELALDASGRWIDVEIPLVDVRSARSLEISAPGELWVDALRVEEVSPRFAIGAPYLGRSAKFDRDVADVLGPFLANTALLGVLSLLFTWALALPLGIWCGVHRHHRLDRAFSWIAFLGLSLPSFFVALLVLWLAGVLANDWSREHWGCLLFPTGGASSGEARGFFGEALDRLHHLVLPVFVVSIAAIASLQRVTRGNLIEVLRAHYVRTARAKGLPEHRVIYRHALRNALNPLITLFGFQLSALLSGAALVEVIFSYPGLGKLVLEAIRDQDRNVVMAAVLASGVLLVIGNLCADLLLAWIDPRVRLARSGDER